MDAVHRGLEVSSQLNFFALLHEVIAHDCNSIKLFLVSGDAVASCHFPDCASLILPSSSAIFGCLSLPRCEYRRRRGNTWREESRQLALNKTRRLFSWRLKDACAAALCVGLRRHYTNKEVLNMKERLAFKAGLLTAAVCCAALVSQVGKTLLPWML